MYKRETIKLVALTCSVHREEVQQFLPKIMSNICLFLKVILFIPFVMVQDKDSSIRDACVESLAVICMYVPPPPAKENLGVYLKPLFNLLSEQVRSQLFHSDHLQNKHYQTGAVMCLEAVVRNSFEEYVVEQLDNLVQRLQRLISQPSCLVKGGLYSLLGALVEVTHVHSLPHIPTLLSLLLDGMEASEWADRKGAADGIKSVGKALGKDNSISPYKHQVLEILNELKFDKVQEGMQDSYLIPV